MMKSSKSALPGRETVIEVAFSAIYGQDLKSVKELVSWIGRKEVERALKNIEPKKIKHPKVEGYLEKVITNSAKVNQGEDGARHIRLIPVNKAAGMAIRYYFKSTSDAAVWGKLRKMARRIRNRVYIRFYRMPEDKLKKHIRSAM
jgi:hypothetical protein